MSDLEFGDTIKGFTPGQKVFARYTLSRILGRGGMGVVWLARDDKLERDIALKFLPEIVVLDPKAIEELKREAKRNLDLTHPHIVRIHDFVDDSRSAAIAMEYVDGSSLSKQSLAQPGGCFQTAQLQDWLRQLCAALDYAHQDARVVHRDLKPANLMIDGRGRLKVTDFGIARSIADSVSRVSAQAGSSGTPVYMSPQQMMGEKPAITDDIYALGATLYELLTGKPPFHSGNILLQVQSKVPPPVSERRAELGVSGESIPPEWEQTIASCLAKEPKDRPQSAGEVAERLGLTPQDTKSTKRRTEDKKVEHGVPTRAEPFKTPLYVGLVAAVLVLGGLGWYFGIHAPGQQRLAAERVAEEKRLAEIVRLENERRTEEANQLRTERERAEAEARARAERERREAERLANARGGIVVRTNPAGAEVRVGAIALEKSPLTLKEQKLGKYPVRVRMDGYEDWSGEVEVKENEFSDLDVALVRSTGRVVLTGTAGATVTTGDRTLGTLPLTLDNVPIGAVRYALTLKGHKPAELSGEVTRNAELRLSATLEKQLSPQPGLPWENSIGQKFVPVPGTQVLFCIWETRVRDFEVFVRETGYDATLNVNSIQDGRWGAFGHNWKNPGFSQGPMHPVCGVNWFDAQAFCAWLTQKERALGVLRADQAYRLPLRGEWFAAVGPTTFPWGNEWPPTAQSGNYGGTETRGSGWPSDWPMGESHFDGYPRTSPVGSFAANPNGLFDMGGNVVEWSADSTSSGGNTKAMFGGCFYESDKDRERMKSRFESNNLASERNILLGFRLVLVTGLSP